ncbi:SpoIIE family protein phosphatase [Kitasatospora sp. NPDC087314]|uniref:SpoIIE family protein phosphatase n=1 Tax=Kitasatospora sp. NPDC087314 TaxID=3364068 RepID=UPI00382FD043
MTVEWDDIRALNVAHERFLGGLPVADGCRGSVLRSWRRCYSQGVRADRIQVLYHQDLDFRGLLGQLAQPVLDDLEAKIAGIKVSALLCDEQVRVLARRVGEPSLNAYCDSIQLAPGFGFPEPIVGTNGMGTALASRRREFICGREHFADFMRSFACAAAPIRDPLGGRILGALDLTCEHDDAHINMMNLVDETAKMIERRLLSQIRGRDRALLYAFHRARRRAGVSAASWSDRPVSAWLLPEDRLESSDRIVLLETAAEMISAGRTCLTVVQLRHGRVATLLCRAVDNAAGPSAFAVEAVLPDGALRCLDSTAMRATETIIGQDNGSGPDQEPAVLPPSSAATLRTSPSPPSPSSPWLVAIGEPGVGRLALRSRQRLSLLSEAGRLGSSLDVTRTAKDLTEVAVPKLADFAAVDIPDAVLSGEEPPGLGEPVRRVALSGIRPSSHLYEVGDLIRYAQSTPQAISLASEESVLEPELNTAPGWIAQDPDRTERIREEGIHSLIAVPLRARGVVLGVVVLYRSEQTGPFEEDDLLLAEELVSRAAVSIDNARRYTREYATALALQTSLLPHDLPDQDAVEAAHRYVPARGGAGGDWFDVIPLSGARVALVVGDVVGRGVQASATMGRLCTAVRNFSDLDLPVEEVLAHLDDLVERLEREQQARTPTGNMIAGATCLYAVYDPVSRCLTLASAGHPPPALIRPDGHVDFPDVPTGPPLGLGWQPFETLEIELDEGSELVLFTNGLLRDGSQDPDIVLAEVRDALTRPAGTPEEMCRTLLEALLPAKPRDDVALLVARTRSLDGGQVAQWDLPADPAAVSGLRSAVARQLADWGLEELTFSTELIISELATNAIRYGGPPIQVRLLRSLALICEVTDGSSTSPRLRRATSTDEGGRGLFLVAQLAHRWGTRYIREGKVIWAEQPFPDTEHADQSAQ